MRTWTQILIVLEMSKDKFQYLYRIDTYSTDQLIFK